MRTRLAILIPVSLLTACNVKEKIEEKVTEKVIEGAAEGEVEVDIDSKQGSVRITDEQGETYDYSRGPDGSAKVEGSDGLDASLGTKIPEDFPFVLPAAKQVALANRVVEPDGSKAFTVNYQAQSDDLEAVAKQIQTAMEGQGLTVERTEFAGAQGKMITLTGKHENGQTESTAMISATGDQPGVMVVAGWADKK